MTIVCEWKSWDRYLIQALRPPGVRLSLDCFDNTHAFVKAVTAIAAPEDTLLFHIDLTEPGRLPFLTSETVSTIRQLEVTLWNSRITDISKAAIQNWNRRMGLPTTKASREGADDFLIVKTNYNSFGVAESRVSPADCDRLLLPRFEDPLHLYEDYPVMHRSSIPQDWWTNPLLSVERLIQNEDGEFFRMYVAGEKVVLCRCTSGATIKRTKNADHRTNYFLNHTLVAAGFISSFLPGTAAHALTTGLGFSKAFGLDFGAIDIVRDDERVAYVVDVNPTPWWGGDEQAGVLEHLRKGFRTDPGVSYP